VTVITFEIVTQLFKGSTPFQGDKNGKNRQFFLKKLPSKKGQNTHIKTQFESPKCLTKNTLGNLKIPTTNHLFQ
jgi:hypothetical protein